MLIKTRDNCDIPSSEITDEETFYNRRLILKSIGLGMAAASTRVGASQRQLYQTKDSITGPDWLEKKLTGLRSGPYSTNEKATPYEFVAGYNNFYEFGTDKSDPAENAGGFITDPWAIEIKGEAEVTGKFQLEDILKPHDLEERVYRLRCVEAWSMVVPWVGFPLKDLLARFKPTSDAKYVRFETLYDPEQMPEQRSRFASIDYPYVEGLRIDEAMNELAFMVVGVYGKTLPNQNGAPIRLIVPWKYGFKSIKSIVGIEFTKRRPGTTWQKTNPREYGFYANVNPNVDHPRWSQARERRLPSSLFSAKKTETLMFNGYAPQVAHLYRGMNLKKNY
ncbi:MAG: protein-methionine-sulfoxide reductase catalytic subunit MsrP [Gammaproteobacteria bacterium]|jgi:methionine sulfoxide reductase catalytic subunit|nr:protein-methionine-sulfoxide reductase catalytic subunit MsrP [Gammaproteobacteria bacterium]MBT4493341.1 protein-methionine-sulfoxide reductase catalytic subunit MsrP [Gammaproteobacteria bacterium]MBT7371131.1 protein-methionine-sulfoxide reductase catalytic subunit MsrP [Gammaproteobacteria bacterium]